MRFAPTAEDETRLTLKTEVPGYGPIASRNVRDRSRAVALSIARGLSSGGEAGTEQAVAGQREGS